MSRLMHERIGGSELRILPRLKHSILIEAPEIVAGLIVPFLEGKVVPEVEALARKPGN